MIKITKKTRGVCLLSGLFLYFLRNRVACWRVVAVVLVVLLFTVSLLIRCRMWVRCGIEVTLWYLVKS